MAKRKCLSIAIICLVTGFSISKTIAMAASTKMPDTLVNSLGMKFVRIEPGSFLMGQQKGGDWDERPVHKVTVTKPFYMAVTEVTNAQYEQFDPQHRKLRGKLGFSGEDDETVVFVSWDEAAKFCEWLSKKEGRSYHLPTEAEWEYACRAGTTTAYHTGNSLPGDYHKNQVETWEHKPVPLHVATTPANPLGLFDMHGNVEEWCYDWYGPYEESDQTDPVGHTVGDFKVTRGGSHSTPLPYLRSANRLGMLPEDKSWLIGFRVVIGELPDTKPFPLPVLPLNRQNVNQHIPADLTKGPDPNNPYFKGPIEYVKIPPGSDGPIYPTHNHDPALVSCPNGDLLAIWYSCRTEAGRELAVLASRLRYGCDQWEPASVFWDAPDRNDHAPALWFDGQSTIYHFNGLSAAATWGNLALIMRTSTDNGATWSNARLIGPEHGLRHQPVQSVFQTREGFIILPCDAAAGGSDGTAVHHAGIVQLKDGTLMALGRGNDIDSRMPMSLSRDMGQTWTYLPSQFPLIGGGQRLILRRLHEGPILLVSFTGPRQGMSLPDAAGKLRQMYGMFAAISFDEGKTWPTKRLITDGGRARKLDGGGNTGWFVMDQTHAEPKGYLAATQTPNGLIHLISSKQHYVFNLAWLKEPMPKEKE
ncbi:MAG: SUMF1/EgtB/PvdO family nonheme iron enzyme [Planctomycetota bacterium]|nr:SUMF1/EgtB/PvdO family nonheme iron enzyme [Planctomycetota bacterium]